MLEIADRGLNCPAADLYIDRWLPVDRAVITHAESVGTAMVEAATS